MLGPTYVQKVPELLGREQKTEMFQHEMEQGFLHIADNGGFIPVKHRIGTLVGIIPFGIVAVCIHHALQGGARGGGPFQDLQRRRRHI
ncbi:hypothetical protein Amal_03974 [Acetobacter malorum]|uniref:Uncharacterized protein n=1 Tax=Acetobacter malorum TaxID=178901 RepID=A0A177G1D4_9PROT|nr:hypothetical protein Amal_03974 [Acetobacter malorum]